MISPSRCLQGRKGSEGSPVQPVPQDPLVFRDTPLETELVGSRDHGDHRGHRGQRDLQAHLDYLGKMDSL